MPSTKRQASKRAAPDREYGSKKRRRDDSTYNREQGRSGGQANIPREELLNEIYALGGDEDDLRLILDVSSQSEHGDTEVPVSVPPRLGDELAELAVTLGLSQAAEAEPERGSINSTAGVKIQAEAPLKLPEVGKKTVRTFFPDVYSIANGESRPSSPFLNGTPLLFRASQIHDPIMPPLIQRSLRLSSSMHGSY